MDGIELKPLTKNTITDKATLLNLLREYREQGYSIDNEEIEEGLFCVAAPILDISNQIISAVSISLPKYRVKDRLEDFIHLVKDVAKQISFEMGQTTTDI